MKADSVRAATRAEKNLAILKGDNRRLLRESRATEKALKTEIANLQQERGGLQAEIARLKEENAELRAAASAAVPEVVPAEEPPVAPAPPPPPPPPAEFSPERPSSRFNREAYEYQYTEEAASEALHVVSFVRYMQAALEADQLDSNYPSMEAMREALEKEERRLAELKALCGEDKRRAQTRRDPPRTLVLEESERQLQDLERSGEFSIDDWRVKAGVLKTFRRRLAEKRSSEGRVEKREMQNELEEEMRRRREATESPLVAQSLVAQGAASSAAASPAQAKPPEKRYSAFKRRK